MTSFAGVGNQIGIALCVLECFLLEKFLPPDALMKWGWRISFIMGGFIGLFGFYLRHKLHETKLFHEMVAHHKISRKSTLEVLKANWKGIGRGISYGAAQTSSFHLVSILFPVYLYRALDIKYSVTASFGFIAIMTVSLPFFGLLGDKFGCRKLLVGACIAMLGLLYPLYASIHSLFAGHVVWIMGIFVLCIACITALWPFLISNLFRTQERYTCVGLSFNIADGFFGSLSILISCILMETTGNHASFIWILLICLVISLMSFFKIKN